LCQDAGLVRSDIYNAKFVPTKTDDSLIGAGDGGALVVVDGKEILAGPNTPEEFTSGHAKGIAFNPDFLERMGYNRLGDLSVLFPRHNRAAWEKIGLAGSNVKSASVESTGEAPAAPGALNGSGNQLSWSQS